MSTRNTYEDKLRFEEFRPKDRSAIQRATLGRDLMKAESEIIAKLLEKLTDKLTTINSHHASLLAFVNDFDLNSASSEAQRLWLHEYSSRAFAISEHHTTILRSMRQHRDYDWLYRDVYTEREDINDRPLPPSFWSNAGRAFLANITLPPNENRFRPNVEALLIDEHNAEHFCRLSRKSRKEFLRFLFFQVLFGRMPANVAGCLRMVGSTMFELKAFRCWDRFDTRPNSEWLEELAVGEAEA